MKNRIFHEELPLWLKCHQTGSRVPFSEIIKSSRMLYYPGSGDDGSPVKNFTHMVHVFLYVDYGLARNDLERQLADSGFLGYHLLDSVDFQESDITPDGWRSHIHPTEYKPTPFSENTKAYCVMKIFERDPDRDDSHGSSRFVVIFLYADGIASYDAIFCNEYEMFPPFILVLADHGFGGNYDRFGAGGLLERIAIRTHVFPEYLLVAKDTEAWKGYERTPNIQPFFGGMHRSQRFLYYWQEL